MSGYCVSLWSKFVRAALGVTLAIATVFIAGRNMIGYGTSNGNHLIHVSGEVMVVSVYIAYFIFCVTSYILIFMKIFESRQNTQTNTGNESSIENGVVFFWRELKQGGYVIPLFITFTYLLIVIIPLLVAEGCYIAGVNKKSSQKVWHVGRFLNNISDALVYVLCDKDIQNHLKVMLGIMFRQNVHHENNVSDNSIQSIRTLSAQEFVEREVVSS